MIVTSKNGVRLDIIPVSWWKIKDWIEVFKEIRYIKKNDIYFDDKSWSCSTWRAVKK